jgi:hypothetical protein
LAKDGLVAVLDADGWRATVAAERKEKGDGGRPSGLYSAAVERESDAQLLARPRRSRRWHQARLEAVGSTPVVSCLLPCSIWRNYRITTDSIFQITPKFSKELKNLQIQKLLKNPISTTLSIKNFQIQLRF